MRFEAILFDVGGVLVASGEPVRRREWERAHNLPVGRLDVLMADAIGPGWKGGRTEAEIWSRLQSTLAVDEADLVRLRVDLFAHEYLEPRLAGFLARVRGTCRLGIITNNGPEARSNLQQRFGLCDLVDCLVVSAEEGVEKPDHEIYGIAASRLDVAPGACIFVDDNAVNVAGAMAVGMTGIVHRQPDATLDRLWELLSLA